MICLFCDRPLRCAACHEPFEVSGQADYEALFRPEVPLTCPSCGAGLACRWCRAPYDGQVGAEAAGDD